MTNWQTEIFFTLSMLWLCTWITRGIVFVIRVIFTKKRAMPRKILPRTYDV